MAVFVTSNVTGYFGVKICHGLVGASRVSFSVFFVAGYQKNVTGEKMLARSLGGLGRQGLTVRYVQD